MVAACISADTGVGPAIASGNQVNKGSCADLPTAPTKSNKVISVKGISMPCVATALGKISENSELPK